MYDVRLPNLRALRGKTAGGGKCVWTARMCCPVGAMAPDGAYVRYWMYDVRLPNSRALRGGMWCVSHSTREEMG